ncbi:MAG: hypothetical protein HQK91_10415 [Nitrospirae bacterium]|nr:hypothetical protein [Nitrospirota bacterium]
MKIAVPIFNNQVSPRFDSARELIIVDAEDGNSAERKRIITIDLPCSEKIQMLVELKINTLLCGGIDKMCEQSLKHYGIQVKSWLSGDAETILTNYLLNYEKFNKTKLKRYRMGSNDYKTIGNKSITSFKII